MLRTLTCPHCGNITTRASKKTSGRRVLCAACGNDFFIALADEMRRRPIFGMMGDDEGGGDSSSSEEEDDDEEDEEGKKKKKKKKGFFATVVGKIVGFVIGVGILSALCCCFFIAGSLGLLPHTPPFVGEWDGTVTQTVQVKEKDDKDKEVVKDEKKSLPVSMKIDKKDDKTGDGVYTVFTDDDAKDYKFRYKDYDKEAKTVVFEMESKDDKFWNDIKSPATFKFDVSGSTLTLTSGSDSQAFTKVVPVKEDKGGGPKKKKRR